LARARAEAERLSGAISNTGTVNSGTANLPRRARGGAVNNGQPTIVGENEPEVFIPGANGVVLNRQQILGNLNLLVQGAGVNVGGSAPLTDRGGQEAVVQQLQALQASIEGRNPTIAPTVTFGSPDSSQFDEYVKFQRSMLRGAI
jgi:hypothetical protein